MPKYANITATLALFIALGGTATAAVTLERDSVTSREIASDAVRPPEIAKDAVRSPEIRADAVRSSEIQDDTIRLEDIADGARQALEGPQGPAGPRGPAGPEGPPGTSEADFTEQDDALVPLCAQDNLTDCINVKSVLLASGSWVVQAKFTAFGSLALGNKCGLVAGDTTTMDEATDLAVEAGTTSEQVSLAGVITVEEPTRVAVRCRRFPPAELTLRDLKLIAISVDEVVSS